MSAALELIRTVEANGGRLRVEQDALVISPHSAALPVVDELRRHKWEIMRLLERSAAARLSDVDEWREPFVRWLDAICIRHPRVFGGVSRLHLSYCEWEIARDGVPCTREMFEGLLSELGFLMGAVGGVMLVSGLTFRDDIEESLVLAEKKVERTGGILDGEA